MARHLDGSVLDVVSYRMSSAVTIKCQINGVEEEWQTSSQYWASTPELSLRTFLNTTDLLLERPNLNSTHLFRADILHDTSQLLQSPTQKEVSCLGESFLDYDDQLSINDIPIEKSDLTSVRVLDGSTEVDLHTSRTVLRRLIPRKPQVDQPLLQTCIVLQDEHAGSTSATTLVVYLPHANEQDQMPFYHPKVRGLAYLYRQATIKTAGNVSVHYLPFQLADAALLDRPHRTILALLNTFIRLAKPSHHDIQSPASDEPSVSRDLDFAPSSLKDTILPQHLVQNTYSILKQKYAADLINRWVEKTEPAKHVFEDLSIAAFLIELWKLMYGSTEFPGFVDIACGNGVLVYILIKEGYQGFGFDARRRKTWHILNIDKYLREQICIPKPFHDALAKTPDNSISTTLTSSHDGILPPSTFIISNHADELTVWTPILAALSASSTSPLPFLAIPCCSHALSGARHRYNLPTPRPAPTSSTTHIPTHPATAPDTTPDDDVQPKTGDLKSLRALKLIESNNSITHAAVLSNTPDTNKSQYACLTRKVVDVAKELGMDVELTLMRIPSTRNIGIVGNCFLGRRKGLKEKREGAGKGTEKGVDREDKTETPLDAQLTMPTMEDRINLFIERECVKSGGVVAAARLWVDGAVKLSMGGGSGGRGERGKVNLHGHRPVETATGDRGTAAVIAEDEGEHT